MAEQLAAMVVDGDFDRAAAVLTEGRRSAGHGQGPGQVDRVAGGDVDTADGIGAFERGRRGRRLGSQRPSGPGLRSWQGCRKPPTAWQP